MLLAIRHTVPICRRVLDRFCDLGHNAIAHVFCEAAQEEGLQPQKGETGLLHSCPDSGGLPQRASLDGLAGVIIHGEDSLAEKIWTSPSLPAFAEQLANGAFARWSATTSPTARLAKRKTLVTRIGQRMSTTRPDAINLEFSQGILSYLHRDIALAFVLETHAPGGHE